MPSHDLRCVVRVPLSGTVWHCCAFDAAGEALQPGSGAGDFSTGCARVLALNRSLFEHRRGGVVLRPSDRFSVVSWSVGTIPSRVPDVNETSRADFLPVEHLFVAQRTTACILVCEAEQMAIGTVP